MNININNSNFIFTEGESEHTLWPGDEYKIIIIIIYKHMDSMIVLTHIYTPIIGGAPYDGSAENVIQHSHKAIQIVYSMLASTGLLFAVGCLVFNVVFRKTK